MTKNNKQIIIDGVDVSGCAFYGFSNLNNHLCRSEEFSKIDCTYCNNNPNCYHKQLKRKEKVCKEWKEEYRAKVEELNSLEDKLKRKEQECEELTTKCSQLKKENEIFKNFLKEENCNFDKIKDLVNEQ